MELQNRFFQLLGNLDFSETQITEFWQSLSKAYSGKSRYYHNLQHIQNMLNDFDMYKNHIENPLEFQLAVFYHDIIYNVNQKDNEEKSAEVAVEAFKSTSVNTAVLENLILATKHHNAETEDEKWLVDFDLAVLGKSWQDYETYAKQIRKEYRIYPDLLYNPGRKKVLKHFLEKERIFLTDTFFTCYEKQARENLKKEINRF